MFKTPVRLVAVFFCLALFAGTRDASAQWRSVEYDADNFSAGGSMAWTVDETDQDTFAYMVNDRTMTVALVLSYTSLTGTSHNQLFVKIPGGHTAGHLMMSPVHIRRDSGSPSMEVGVAGTSPGADTIVIYRENWLNHQLSTNLSYIYMTITFDLE